MSGTLRTMVPGPGPRLILVAGAVAAGIAVLTAPSADATIPHAEPVILVQEDWVLVLNEPDNAIDAPQFHTAMSPYSSLDSLYVQASWNYWDQPEFQSGGLQLQTWDNDECKYDKSFFQSEQLSTNAETITWTQTLATNGEVLAFQIDNGNSLTWGQFGGTNMSIQGDVHVPNLNGYSPSVSVKNSWVSYGSNRVNLLAITEVRYYFSSGLFYRDTTPKVVFQLEAE